MCMHISRAGHKSKLLLVLHLVIVYPLYEGQTGHFGLHAQMHAVTALCAVATSGHDAGHALQFNSQKHLLTLML